MRDVVRRICVCLFVVSFVFSGATWAACFDCPAAQASAAPAAAAHDHRHAADHATHHHAGSEQAAVADQIPPGGHDHAHTVKCCSMVPAFSLAPSLSTSPVIFSGALISFRVAQRDLTGFIVALEPGIPKPIV
jgi:hypothetical protein